MILHLCPRDVWVAAQAAGTYEGDTLATQGFIHFSTEKQVHLPATRLFRGRTDLLLLEIDEQLLPAPLTWEEGDGPGSDLFPHLYAALPLAAVVSTREYLPEPDGTFAPPLWPIVTGLLRDGDRVLLCHRTAERLHSPDCWDLPGGHVEPGELPAAALVRELREELGVDVAQPVGPPLGEIRTATMIMQVWLVETWSGTPANVAPQEHDAIGWFAGDELGGLRLGHDGYLALFTEALKHS